MACPTRKQRMDAAKAGCGARVHRTLGRPQQRATHQRDGAPEQGLTHQRARPVVLVCAVVQSVKMVVQVQKCSMPVARAARGLDQRYDRQELFKVISREQKFGGGGRV